MNDAFLNLDENPPELDGSFKSKGMTIRADQWKQVLTDIAEAEKKSPDDSHIKIVDLTKPDVEGESPEPVTSYSFFVFYKTSKKHKLYMGSVLMGAFSGHISTFRDQIAVGRMVAHLRGGAPSDSFDSYTNVLMNQQAMLQILLDNTPDWFQIEELTDLELPTLIYEEVIKREADFRGAIL